MRGRAGLDDAMASFRCRIRGAQRPRRPLESKPQATQATGVVDPMRYFHCFLFLLAALLPIAAGAGTLHDEREVHLTEVRQLTHGGENAEAYWSPDGDELILQSTRPPYECDQIYRLPLADPAGMTLVSTGAGRTTCAYFSADAERIIYSSTHAASAECPPTPDFSRGYVWPIYESYEIYSAAPDGSDPRPLTDTPTYDAEATVCPVDGSIVFTSARDGDLELYRMDADGGNVRRLTETPGYDGGAFFSRDCSKIVWRASRPTGQALEDYRALLGEGLVRPGELEIWVANADGSEARRVTDLGGANFAPYFYPDGERIIFSSNHDNAGGREFNIWAINVDGTGLEQITYTEGFDGFPMFSPDGQWLVFASNRNQGKPGETDVYVARWVDAEAGSAEE
jgi:Tol biopolymer transport system component